MVKERRIDLSKYRFERAKEEIDASKELLSLGYVNASASRSYYSVFYTLLAVTSLDGFESSKHSGIISYFNRYYVKTKIFDGSISEIIRNSFEKRTNADYGDFYKVSNVEAESQIGRAEKIIEIIQPYLESRWAELEKE